jgi:hypothetical protein
VPSENLDVEAPLVGALNSWAQVALQGRCDLGTQKLPIAPGSLAPQEQSFPSWERSSGRWAKTSMDDILKEELPSTEIRDQGIPRVRWALSRRTMRRALQKATARELRV